MSNSLQLDPYCHGQKCGPESLVFVIYGLWWTMHTIPKVAEPHVFSANLRIDGLCKWMSMHSLHIRVLGQSNDLSAADNHSHNNHY